MSEIEITIENPNNDKGKPITKIEVSPNGKYLVTYSQEDGTIVGWNVNSKVNPDNDVQPIKTDGGVDQICVSDDKKFAYIYVDTEDNNYKLKIIDMKNKGQEIKLYFDFDAVHYYYCAFNLKNEFILCNKLNDYDDKYHKIIWVYSTQTKWKCKKIYEIPDDAKLISISKYDKLYLFSNNFIHEWDFLTETSIKIFKCDVDFSYNDDKSKLTSKNDIRISSDKNFICLRIKDKIVIYSTELEIPIISYTNKNDDQFIRDLMDIMDTSLCLLLLPLFDYIRGNWYSVIKHCLKECLVNKECTECNIQTINKHIFVVLDGYPKKIELNKKSPDLLFSFKNSIDKNNEEPYNYMNIIRTLLQEGKNKIEEKKEQENQDYEEYKIQSLKIITGHKRIELQVYDNDPRKDELNTEEIIRILAAKLLDNNDIVILTTIGLIIYHFNENNNSISLTYFYYIKLNDIIFPSKYESLSQDYDKVFSNSDLPSPNHESFKLYDEWKNALLDNDDIFLKYGGELLLFAIKEREFNIYKKKFNLFSKRNKSSSEIKDSKEDELINNICKKTDNKEILLKYGDKLLSFAIENKFELIENIYDNIYKKMDDKEILLKYYDKLLSFVIKKNNLELIKNVRDNIYKIIDDKEILLKYGDELLSFAIKENELELIDNIYKKCLIYFKEDSNNNNMVLSIIAPTMPLLNKHYPERILNYSSETTMILDSPTYNIERRNNNLHLYTFSQNPQLINLTRSILWMKFIYFLRNHDKHMLPMLFYIQLLIIIFTLPLFFIIFYILLKFHFITDFYKYDNALSFVYFVTIESIKNSFSESILTPTITFMIPYIKFVNYSRDYSQFWELIWPKPSPFTETISKDIYKTWDGEALINFKWNTYGKYYYWAIWMLFTTFLVCFNIAATISHHLGENIKKGLLITSIILGPFHLIQEFRQFIRFPKEWIQDYWNFFDLGAFLVPTATSIYWLYTNNENTTLLSFSCLLLDIKFLLFFRAFESFGIYFAIIIGVAERIIYFLGILFIILVSFAHAFLILLRPRLDYSLDQPTINDDNNNPWNLNTTFYQIENNTIMQNPSFVQAPDENTNLFTDYKTALFAVYLFLTGDPSALSDKWEYKDNPTLVVIMVLFSFLIVVYLMNLFIGLLNMEIEKDYNRISYLTLKAKILAEIELHYLLPHQRRRKDWFPDVLYYYADVGKAREKVKEMIEKDEWSTEEYPELGQMKKDLLDKLNIKYKHISSDVSVWTELLNN